MYSEDYVDGNGKRDLSLVRQGVQFAVENDLYAIVDWHVLSEENPKVYLAEAITFFNQMAKEYANVVIPVIRLPADCFFAAKKSGNG